MEIITSESLAGSRVYFTEADILSQSRYLIERNELLIKLKLSLLLNDHVVLAASHVFESELTFTILEENPKLLESDAILICLRKDCHDFTSFARMGKNHDRQSYYQRVEEQDRLNYIASFLNMHATRAIEWSPNDTSADFKQTLIKDLQNENSPICKELRDIGRESLENITSEIEDTTFLTREIISDFCNKYIRPKKDFFEKYVSILYYLNGASQIGEPVMHPEAVSLCENRFSSILNTIKSRTEEQEAFDRLLNKFSIPTSALESLPIKQLLEIRECNSSKRFRKEWNETIERAKKDIKREHTIELCPQIMNKILNELINIEQEGLSKELIDTEKGNGTQFEDAKKVLLVNSLVTSFAKSIMMNPTLGKANLVRELANIDPLLKRGGTEITLFCSHLQ